jgi:hypothetical protein
MRKRSFMGRFRICWRTWGVELVRIGAHGACEATASRRGPFPAIKNALPFRGRFFDLRLGVRIRTQGSRSRGRLRRIASRTPILRQRKSHRFI